MDCCARIDTNRIDARGLYVLAGSIDLHCDDSEQAIEPQPSAGFPSVGHRFDADDCLQQSLFRLDRHAMSARQMAQRLGLTVEGYREMMQVIWSLR